MHYDVDRRQLRALAARFEELAEIQRRLPTGRRRMSAERKR